MNWWSVICKAPLDLRRAGRDLYAQDEQTLKPLFDDLYAELDELLSVKINKFLMDNPRAKKLSAVIKANNLAHSNLLNNLKQLEINWKRTMGDSAQKLMQEKLKTDFNTSDVQFKWRGENLLVYMKNPKAYSASDEGAGYTQMPTEGWETETPESEGYIPPTMRGGELD
jgi:hypothetical protein